MIQGIMISITHSSEDFWAKYFDEGPRFFSGRVSLSFNRCQTILAVMASEHMFIYAELDA